MKIYLIYFINIIIMGYFDQHNKDQLERNKNLLKWAIRVIKEQEDLLNIAKLSYKEYKAFRGTGKMPVLQNYNEEEISNAMQDWFNQRKNLSYNYL